MKLIVHLLNPVLRKEIDPWSRLVGVDETCLIDILRRNKVALEFEQRIETNHILKEKVLKALPEIKLFLANQKIKRERDLSVFSEISNVFHKNNVDFLLIKSGGFFPFGSDNLDILVRPEMLSMAAGLLVETGYYEIRELREPHKFLFRNKHAPEVLPLHIHTCVEWEGTQFVDSKELWKRRRFDASGGVFLIPSPEDCILITVAHLFFENHELELASLFKIASQISDYDLDWNYSLEHSRRLHWGDAFCLTMLLVNQTYQNLFGQTLIKQSVLNGMFETTCGSVVWLRKIMKPFDSGFSLLKIPYSLAAIFFLRRILSDSNASLPCRFSHIGWVASDILRRRILWPHYSVFS